MNTKLSIFKSTASALLFLFLAGVTQAQVKITPTGKTAPPKAKSLIVETIHPYTLYEYTLPIETVDLKAVGKASFANPESTLQTYFTAMKASDYQAFIACWTKSSQILMKEKDKQINFTEAKWRSLCALAFNGKQIYLTHWINYGKYVLINYKVTPSEDPATSEITVALVQEAGEWKLTQELRGDQLLTAWRSPNNRVQVPSDALLSR